ncbi:MAG: choice-of-anchor Q domain-containing protein, partial [Chloroflexota bacterium]
PTGGDFRLRPGSAAIDVGSADAAPTNDLDGFHRPQDGDGDGYAVHDLGAYERMPQAPRLYLPGVRRQ